VRTGIPPKSVGEIKAGIIQMLSDPTIAGVPKSDVIEAMKQSSPWNHVKKFGSVAIPNGDAQKDFLKLILSLEEIGIYLVQEGEAENFCREIGSHGPKFVTKLLSNIPLGDERLLALRAFVKKVHKGQSAPLPDSACAEVAATAAPV
jgi:hypothetical protein